MRLRLHTALAASRCVPACAITTLFSRRPRAWAGGDRAGTVTTGERRMRAPSSVCIRVALAMLPFVLACSSPDDSSGDVQLILVKSPEKATPGSTTPQSIIVKAVSGDGTAIPGVPVAWIIQSGGGQLQASADTSGVDGLAVAQWTPGLQGASQTIGAYIYDQLALTITVATPVFHASKLATNFERGCGLQGTAVWCWRDDVPARPIRRIMPQLEAKDVAASYWFACILDPSGTTFCNRAFEDFDPQSTFTVPGLPPLKSISGSRRMFCGLALADETPWCWQEFEMVPQHMTGTPALSRLSTGGRYACGIDAGGGAWCWTMPLGSPALIPGGHAFRSLSADYDASAACGIEGAAILCWLESTPPERVAHMSAGQVALSWPFSLVNTGPVVTVSDTRANYEASAFGFTLVPYEAPALPIPVRQVYPACVLTYDNAAYCLAAYNLNEPVYPARLYWKAVPAPQP